MVGNILSKVPLQIFHNNREKKRCLGNKEKNLFKESSSLSIDPHRSKGNKKLRIAAM